MLKNNQPSPFAAAFSMSARKTKLAASKIEKSFAQYPTAWFLTRNIVILSVNFDP
jgi:hypothetical protein